MIDKDSIKTNVRFHNIVTDLFIDKGISEKFRGFSGEQIVNIYIEAFLFMIERIIGEIMRERIDFVSEFDFLTFTIDTKDEEDTIVSFIKSISYDKNIYWNFGKPVIPFADKNNYSNLIMNLGRFPEVCVSGDVFGRNNTMKGCVSVLNSIHRKINGISIKDIEIGEDFISTMRSIFSIAYDCYREGLTRYMNDDNITRSDTDLDLGCLSIITNLNSDLIYSNDEYEMGTLHLRINPTYYCDFMIDDSIKNARDRWNNYLNGDPDKPLEPLVEAFRMISNLDSEQQQRVKELFEAEEARRKNKGGE